MRACVVCLLVVFTAVSGLSQIEDWRARMKDGADAERAGDFAAASRSYRAAAEIAGQFDRRDGRRASSWNALAMMDDAMGQFATAESAYRQALKAAEDANGKESSNYYVVLGNLGTLYAETGQVARGEKMVTAALVFYLNAEPRDELRIATLQNCLAEVLMVNRKFADADHLLASALPVFEKHPENTNDIGTVLNNMGVIRVYLGQYAEGEQLLLRALAQMERRMGPDHPLLLRTLSNLAALAGRMGNREAAETRLNRALGIAEERLGTDHPLYGMLLANYAAYLREGGEKSRAKALQARSAQILKDSGRRNGIGSVIDISALKPK